MRSATTSHRRLHPGPAAPRRIDAIAHLVDEGTVDEPHHVLVHVIDEGDDLQLGLKPLEPDTHPFGEVAGFTAPPDWSMFGMSVRGTARFLDGGRSSERTSTTFIVDRDGAESSILRTTDGVEPLAGPAHGTIPDLCRRVLGLPTAPPPPTTALLWSVAWLDRVIDAWGDPARRRQLSSRWSQLAVLHPAVEHTSEHDVLTLDDPAHLVTLARAHTAAWPWARLRGEPEVLHLPDGHLPTDITSWMDDGFYARWAFGAFPDPATLARDLIGLLDPELHPPFVETLEGLLVQE